MRHFVRQWGFVFALWGMVLTALIPAGYMPQFGAGAGWMTICTLDGAQEIKAALPDAPVHKAKAPCAFALLGNGVKQDIAPSLGARFVTISPVVYIVRSAQFSPRTVLQGALSLRGPPAFLG